MCGPKHLVSHEYLMAISAPQKARDPGKNQTVIVLMEIEVMGGHTLHLPLYLGFQSLWKSADKLYSV